MLMNSIAGVIAARRSRQAAAAVVSRDRGRLTGPWGCA